MSSQSTTLSSQIANIDSFELSELAETAVRADNIDLLKQCYERGFWATRKHLDAAENHGNAAYESKSEDAIDSLLMNGYSNHVNTTSDDGKREETIDFLFKNGYSETVNDQLLHGLYTPLVMKAFRRRKDTVRYLLDQGADPNIQPGGPSRVNPNPSFPSRKMKPLAVAARLNSSVNKDEINDTEMLEMLLNAGAEPRTTAALHIVSFLGSLPRMKCLIELGADVNEVLEREVRCQIYLRNKGLSTPLHWAIEGGNKDAIRLLLSNRPNLELEDDDGVSVKARLEEFDKGLFEEHCG